jgi:hypothetical protein
MDVKASNISMSICLNFNSYLMALFFNNLISTSKFLTAIFRKEENTLVEYNNRGYNDNQTTRRRKNKAKINENYIEPDLYVVLWCPTRLVAHALL